MVMMDLLADLRVVAVEQYGAGPWASLQLAELGADVIKIEDPATGGDVGRYVPPHQQGQDSLFFETFNRDKRSVALDLRSDAGREVFADLVRVSDAILANVRADVAEALGLAYEHLREVNETIVCCRLSAFGHDPDDAAKPGYDYVVQGMAGWMSLTGEPDGPPQRTGLSLVDWSTGLAAAMAILAGVHGARRDGRGGDVDVSLYDTALSLLTYQATWFLTRGDVPERLAHSAHPSLVPFQLFETQDGWIVVACAKERFWQRLTGVLGDDRLAADERFATFAARAAHRDELVDRLRHAFLGRSSAAWLAVLSDAGVPCGPVHDVPAALDPELLERRGMLVTTQHPRFGAVRELAGPVRTPSRRTEHRRGPKLGEHRDEILIADLGYGQDKIDRLARAGAFGVQAGGGG